VAWKRTQLGRCVGIGAQGRTVGAHTALEVCDLSQCGVLSAGAQQVAQRAAVDAPVAALVEELEGFAVVGGGLVVVIHCVRLSALPCALEGVCCEKESAECADGCRVTESCRAVLCWPKGSVVPCLVDRQWQACAANQQPRSRFHSPLPFLVNATCLLPLLTIVYVCV
jgi:hypothetical protein